MKIGLPLMKNMLQALAKCVLITLGFTAAAAAAAVAAAAVAAAAAAAAAAAGVRFHKNFFVLEL